MCIGIPMQVMREGEFQSPCSWGTQTETVDMRLIGPQPAGTWVLVFRDTAREVLSAERAGQIAAALEGLRHATNGLPDVECWFSDLVGREPQLPDFLREKS
ncbi:MAG: hydrogenase assembly chaperone hypC/hupF [Proteobacteria bacterium]|nr:hydrogenase assembly chaperone hypC/hupF [Pseudomonadota bacterium]